MSKLCRVCQCTKPLDDFHRNSRSPDGHMNICKPCQILYVKSWYAKTRPRRLRQKKATYEANKPQILAQQKESYKRNREKRLIVFKAYRDAHPEEVAAVKKAWRLRHLAQVSAKDKAYREANLTELRQKKKAYREANAAKIAAKKAADRLANLETVKAKKKAYNLAHPEKKHAAHARRRAHKRQAPVIENVEIDVVYHRDKGICSLCGERVKRADASLDHIIPLSKGGEHSYRNMALAHLLCNVKKKDRIKTQQMRLF